MNNALRDLIVLLNNEFMSQQAIEAEVESLHGILSDTEQGTTFYAAHELVARNRITNNRKRIAKAIRFSELKPFCFLINKN